MLVDLLKRNHLLKSIATVPWLWESKEPAFPRWVTLWMRMCVAHTYNVPGSTCFWARPLERPGRDCSGYFPAPSSRLGFNHSAQKGLIGTVRAGQARARLIGQRGRLDAQRQDLDRERKQGQDLTGGRRSVAAAELLH
jgi:hypothetical protein